MINKILVVCGPTAVGKTSLALFLANKFNGELVSADSRQVYKGMDIGTGKDLPENSKLKIQNSELGRQGIGFYNFYGVKVWGYDLVDPNGEFSATQYIRIAKIIVDDIWIRKRLPILVGGTGFYIKGVTDGIETSAIPKNVNLRKFLDNKNAVELYKILVRLDSVKAKNMNESDKKNPRRLIRAIEVAQHRLKRQSESVTRLTDKKDLLLIGLTATKDVLNSAIEKRVERRLEIGFENELNRLTRLNIDWRSQSMHALGYRQWKDYFSGKSSKNDVVRRWKMEEKKYAKRQMTWFKKDKRISWFDITEKDYIKNVEKLVSKWYSMS